MLSKPFPGDIADSMKRISPPTDVQAKPITTPATSFVSYRSRETFSGPKISVKSDKVGLAA